MLYILNCLFHVKLGKQKAKMYHAFGGERRKLLTFYTAVWDLETYTAPLLCSCYIVNCIYSSDSRNILSRFERSLEGVTLMSIYLQDS